MQAEDLNLIWKSKANGEKRLKRFREFMICDLCGPEPSEIFLGLLLSTEVFRELGIFVNCVGLPPLFFHMQQCFHLTGVFGSWLFIPRWVAL